MSLPPVALLPRFRIAFLGLAVSALAALPAAAQTPPAIDGNLQDLLQFAEAVENAGTGCAIVLTDPNQDIAVLDPEVIPCVPIVSNYYVNGFDQITAVFVLFEGDLYLGVRTVGIIGDPDGNGNADTSCPETNVVEQAGIGTADSYRWFLDTDCGDIFAPDVEVSVQNNAVNLSGITAVGQEFDFQTTGSDLEVKLTGVEVNGNPLLPLFHARTFVGNTFDGLGEDLSPIVECPPPDLNLLIQKTANPVEFCPGTGTMFTIVVTNPSLVPLNVTLEDVLPAGFTYVGGSTTGAGEPAVAGNLLTFPSFTLDPGESATVTFRVLSPSGCSGVVTNLARATGTFSSPCVEEGGLLTVGPVTDTFDVECVAPAVSIQVPDVTLCVGEETSHTGTVTNNASDPANITVQCTVGGSVQNFSFPNVPAGASRTFPIEVTCSQAGPVVVSCTATSSLVGNEACEAEATDTGTVTCQAPDVEITKTTDPQVTQDDSRVTLVVTNPGPTPLNPVQVSDFWPAGLTFDPSSLTSTCGVTATVVGTTVTFSNFTLNPGQSCTISFDLDCDEFDAELRLNTAIVVAWCDGIDSTDPDNLIFAVRDTAEAPITCEGVSNPACPRTIGFWRAQCAQKPNGSTKVCLEGMENLWRCVITNSGVDQFRLNDGTFETHAQLAALSDADLMTRLCAQLQGPRSMTTRDMAELQYLGLMLNICSGNISEDTPLSGSGGFSGTLGEAVDEIEDALNSDSDLNHWKGVADAINNREGVEAPFCEDENAIYDQLPGCAQDAGDLTPPSAPDYTGAGVTLQGSPNPAVNTATRVWFGVPEAHADDPLELRIFDISGRQLRTLVTQNPGSGLHEVSWDLRDEFGNAVPAGIYFYRLRIGTIQQSERVFVRR